MELDVVELYIHGSSTRDVARLLKISKTSVLQILAKHDIPRKPVGKHYR